MQVILIEDVKSLGKKGTIVKVNDSYARNYIIPHKLGIEATKANLNDLKLQNANAEKLEAAKIANARDMKAAIDGKTVQVPIRAGKDGKVFGSVTSKEVAEAINRDLKVDVDKKKIVMEPIKAIGVTQVNVKLHKDIAAVVNVKVGEA
ncbi:MAG: 50S ribosomal protein L9 [Lachnospiraceae bacterium]|nr:50S ribosomal protein L9 [Lachnospiraceae bacterium]